MSQLIKDELMISEEVCESLLFEYKKFFMISCLAGFPIAPSGFVDEAWHTHINFLKCYFKDCKDVRGKIMHHYPSASDE